MDEILTLIELATRLKVPVKTARQLVAAGTVRGFKVGREWRVLEADLERYVDHQRHVAEQERGERSLPNLDIRKLDGWKTFR